MQLQPSPDLVNSLRLQSQLTTLRAQVDAAGEELTTGQTSDILTRTGGDLSPVFGIDAELNLLEQTRIDLELAEARASGAQAALGIVQEVTGDLGIRLTNAVSTQDAISIPIFAAEASANLGTIVNAFNTQLGGQSLFAGAAVDTIALEDEAVLVADLTAIVAAAPDAATAIADIDTYFAAGGGFDTNFYRGSTQDAPGAAREDGSRIDYLVRADADEARAAMKGIAMTAVVESAGFAGNRDEEAAFLQAAGNEMIAARDDVTALRATIGSAEGAIAVSQDRVSAESAGLQIARNNLTGVDQFEAAARFADLEGQMQSLFLVTSRLSALTLTNYLR